MYNAVITFNLQITKLVIINSILFVWQKYFLIIVAQNSAHSALLTQIVDGIRWTVLS